MGLFQQALLAYDNAKDENGSLVGRYQTGKEPLAPIGHIITTADIVVTLSIKGDFISAEDISKEKRKIIIPVTETSAGRTSGMAPHPLCDQLKYICSYDDASEKRKSAYLEQLQSWIDSEYTDEKLKAICSLVESNTLLGSLEKDGIIKRKPDGSPQIDKALVIWSVLGAETGKEVWRDTELMEKYSAYYLSKLASTGGQVLCAISGEKEPEAQQHLKGVFSLNGNAKLISANDTTNFTYRGRFQTADEAVTIGYVSSQKAHNALKWLCANQGVPIGEREFLCFSPQGDVIPRVDKSLTAQFFGEDVEPVQTVSDYKNQLSKALNGYKNNLIDQMSSDTVIACFDAATTGRLAVTFYSERKTYEYLDELKNWDLTCCWYLYKGEILSPSLYKIATFALGTEHSGKMEADSGILKQTVEELLHCRLSEELFPANIERRLVEKASRLRNFSSANQRELLGIACAAIRKYHYDHFQEEMSMELDAGKKDRSYQFGRLLAVYEKIETDTYGKDESGRETNAMRMQSVYCNQPMHYSAELEKQMERAYFPRLSEGSRIFYKQLIADILNVVYEFPESEWNRPLGDTYLMGYYLQRKSFYTKKEQAEADKAE